MDKLIGIEVNHYGICLDSNWTYIALSWQILVTAAAFAVAFRLYRQYS